MLHTKIKIFTPIVKGGLVESTEKFEERINSFIKDKNVKSVFHMSNYGGGIAVHYSDSTY